MRVALDTNGLFTTQAGVARYLSGLIVGFSQLHNQNLRVTQIAWPVANFAYRQPQRMAKTTYRELIWSRWVAPRRLQRMKAEIYHSTGSIIVPLPRSVPDIHTLYDLAIVRQPGRFRRWQRFSGARLFRHLKAKSKIICISRFTADEAMAMTGLPASRFEVTYLGCSLPSSEQVPAFTVPETFFLFVGSLEPGKNLALLKEVYTLANAAQIALPSLLIIGARWQGVPGEGSPPAEWVYLGRQADGVLSYLYRRAAALVFPSKYEGFGLPVAEAMNLGCPVICSAVASLPEVGGEAVCYAKLDAASYLHAMQRMTMDTDWRNGLVEKGLTQAAQFSWRRCAQETADVYFSL